MSYLKNKFNNVALSSEAMKAFVRSFDLQFRTCLWAILLVMLTSCEEFVDADLDKSLIDEDKVFSNDVTATAAVTGMYNVLLQDGGMIGPLNAMVPLSGLSSSELYNYSGTLPEYIEFQAHSITSKNLFVKSLWDKFYNEIYLSNAILEGVNGSNGLTTSTAKQLEGEARFMRAFMYFYLVNLFGDVPLITSTDYRVNRVISRSSTTTIYNLIKNDLQRAKSILTVGEVTENRVRPNRATATALLSRVHLYLKEFAEAEIESSSLISDTTSFKLNSDISKVFLIGSQETIWQLMPVNPDFSNIEAPTFIVISRPSGHVLTKEFVSSLQDGDDRKEKWLGWVKVDGDTVYFPYKYRVYSKKATDQVTECPIVFRLAEMYLIRAEARVWLENFSGAREDINKIRTRSGLGSVSDDNKNSLLSVIEYERKAEMFTEWGHRWFDLKRTDRALAVIGGGITSNDLLYPIPRTEFILNPYLGEQNPGYSN